VKVFLDDERPTPGGWVCAFTAPEAIELLTTGQVTELSLDHDLGPEDAGTGYDVCLWVEEKVFSQDFCTKDPFTPPIMSVHSANPVGRQRMEFAIQVIYHHFKVTQPTGWDPFKQTIQESRRDASREALDALAKLGQDSNDYGDDYGPTRRD
jgi:hypothetical protein